MAGKKKHSSGSAFSLFGLFKSKNSRTKRAVDDDYYGGVGDNVRAYKVYPSDEDRGRWVAEPGIDKKASAYISLTTDRWEKLAVSN